MSKPLSSRIERLVRARAEKRHELAILTCASLLVVLSVSLVLHHAGVAMSSPNMELACHYQGSGAHHHNADCYDASGALVCPLNERDLHVHDDSCYTEERTLVCGQEECAGHTHDESCYDAEGNLTCGLEESAGHTHTDACYEVTRTLTCGKEEVTEEHVHGPECFAEASVQGVDAALAGQPEPTERASQEPVSDGASDGADQAQPRPARTFEGSLRDANNKVLFKVLVSAPEGALPEGVDLRLAQLDAAAVDEDTVREATAQKADGQLLAYEAVDISFVDATGQVVEPAVPVTVTLGSALVDTDDHVMVVHLDEGDDAARAREAGKVPAEVVDTLGDKALEQREMRLEDDELAFETDRFSPFVLAVTSLRKQMEASDGSSYALAVDAPAEAGIPQDAELEVREIEEGTQEYQQYLAQADEALNVGESEQATDGADLLAEMTVTQQIEAARFFDVSIVVDGQVIEPQAPVQVRVEYLNEPMTLDDESSLKVVHFAEAGTEVIDVEAPCDVVRELSFEQGSFSVSGTVVTSGNSWPTAGQQYVMYVQSGGNYYAVKHDRSLTQVTVADGRLTFPTFTSTDSLDDYLWTYTNSGGNRLSYAQGSTTYYLDPRFQNAVSTTARTLTHSSSEDRLRTGAWNESYYLGVNGNSIVGQRSQAYGVPVQFANAFAVDTPHKATIHFVDRDGNAISGVRYQGSSSLVTANADGTFSIPYDWGNATGSVNLGTEFVKAGYTYANTHLAGTRQGTSLTYDGLLIDATLTERGGNLYYYTDRGDNRGYNSLNEYNLNAASQVYYAATESSAASLVDYTPANADKDIYVILDPVVAGGSTDGSQGGLEDVDDPKFSKKLTVNHDGTYTLSLSVKGVAANVSTEPKANVLLVVDTSSSMDEHRTTTGNTRLVDTQAALRTLGTDLFANNDAPRANDTVELAMVTFDGSVTNELDWTTSPTNYNDKVDGLTVHRGTNWEDALDRAYDLARAKQAEEPDQPIFVIFFTDGEGSQYTNFHGQGVYPGNEGGYRQWYSYFLCREGTKDETRAIVNAGMRLYAVYAYNNSSSTYNGERGQDLLHNALKYGYNTSASLAGSYFFDAGNTSALNDAFAKILKAINESVGFDDVKMSDSITSLTSVGISTLHGETTGFTYTRSGGSYGTGQVWEDAPHASYSEASGVTWDLGNTVLEDGVTYTVSFTVWPSQTAYDWVSDLNNGFKTWQQLVAAGLDDQFLRFDDSSTPSGYRYEVKTNPDSYDSQGDIINNEITYTKTASETVTELPDGVTVDVPIVEGNTTTNYTENADGTYTKTVVTKKQTAFAPPEDNMVLEDSVFKVQKKWVADLQLRQLVEYLYNTEIGGSKQKQIPFELHRDASSEVYKQILLGWDQEGDGAGYTWADDTQTITVGEHDYEVGTLWEKDMDISVGLLLSEAKAIERGLDITDATKYLKLTYNGQNYYLLENGHDYDINEPTVSGQLDYRFDFSTQTYHPMLVDGVPKNVNIDLEANTIVDMDPEGGPLTALTGYNTLRGGINLYKVVQDQFGQELDEDVTCDDRFVFTVTLKNDEAVFVGDNVPWYGVDGRYYHAADGSYGDAGEGMTGNVMEVSDGGKTASVTLGISRTQPVRIANVPAGTTYTIDETPREGYTFVKAGRTVTGTTAYDQTMTNTPSIGGEIVSNKETNVTFTNRQQPTFEVSVLKVGAETSQPLSGAVFALYGADYYVSDAEGQPTAKVNPRAVALQTGLTSDTKGKVSLGSLGSGTYYLVELTPPSGYLPLEAPVIVQVDGAGTLTKDGLPLYVTYTQEGNNASSDHTGIAIAQNGSGAEARYSYTLTVTNTSGVALPDAGGPGTRVLALLGCALLLSGASVLVARRPRRG